MFSHQAVTSVSRWIHVQINSGFSVIKQSLETWRQIMSFYSFPGNLCYISFFLSSILLSRKNWCQRPNLLLHNTMLATYAWTWAEIFYFVAQIFLVYRYAHRTKNVNFTTVNFTHFGETENRAHILTMPVSSSCMCPSVSSSCM
jgi:hypothetical protein